MKRNRVVISLALFAALWTTSADDARAAAVWQVLSVQVDGDPQPWMELVKKAQAMRQRLGISTAQVVQATLAGDATGTYFVSFEYPSLVALGEAAAKIEADAEWPGLLKQLQATSKLVSSSLYVDRTPAGVKATPLPPGGYGTGLAVRLDGDPSAYLALVAKLASINTRLGIPTHRVWQATLAGPATGSFLITLTYPSLAAYETATQKVQADPEAQEVFRQIEATGRKIVSNLLVRDRTPR